MSKVLITRSKLDGLATTIAAKSGATLPLTIAQMDAAVGGIVVGGGDSYTRTVVVPQQTVTPNSSRVATFTSTEYFVDGEYYVVTCDGTEYIVTSETLWSNNVVLGDAQAVWQTSDLLYPFALITDGSARESYFTTTSQHTIKVEHLEFVDGPLTIIAKSVTANGTYNASSDNADGYSSVTVNVPSGGVDTSGDTVDAAHLLDGYTAHDSTGSAIVGTYTPPTFTTQAKTATPTSSQQTVTPDSGYDGLSSVTVAAMPTGTAGTPTATKGTVSNHSVSVTPSVTNTTGYITGGTKTGTAVTVSASELVSGNKSITQNGNNIDVTDYATVSVSVSGGGGSMNVQVAQSTTRATSTTYKKVISLTCGTTGTYDVYWSTHRSSTTGTWGSQLYLGDTAYGSAITSEWSEHIQNNHFTGVSISANQEVSVYARSRGNGYYGYVGTLTIIQTA